MSRRLELSVSGRSLGGREPPFGRSPAANRLCGTCGEKTEIITIGETVTPNEAYVLAEQDKFQFQWWALGLVSTRPVEQKKGAD
jgi:hypothetical protein